MTGRPRTCTCGTCKKCKHREYERKRYQAKTLEERRATIARRDPEKVRQLQRRQWAKHRERKLKQKREYRLRNREAINAKQRQWWRDNRDWFRAYYENLKDRRPEQVRAWRAVQQAVKTGKLVRQPCETCEATPAEAHHPDYSKPLEVRWLCRPCHAELHRTLAGGDAPADTSDLPGEDIPF